MRPEAVFNDHDDILLSIRRVQRHLREDYIQEECRSDPQFGCISCHAVKLYDELEGLAAEVEDDQARIGNLGELMKSTSTWE
jgi:hypothetical protein